MSGGVVAFDDGVWDVSWLSSSLAMGGRWSAQHPPAIAALGIRRVVDLREEDLDDVKALQEAGISHLHLPTPDKLAVALDALDRGVAWVQEGIARGERVLIHCEHGIGRSSLLALCVLVTEGRTPKEALTHAKGVRSRVSPSPEQLHRFLAWCEAWTRKTGRAPFADTWEELACIAYANAG